MQPTSTAHEAMRAALATPPLSSSEADKRLLDLAAEAGIGGHALSLLERIDIASLSAHDRITYLRQVTACGAWFEAFQTIATAAVAGPTSGWPEVEVDEQVTAEVAEVGGGQLSEGERLALSASVRDEAWEVRERAIALEVSMATRVSPRTAGRRIDSARLLVESMPRALGQAWEGNWGYGHLRVAEKELIDVPAPLREQVLDDALPYAATDHPRRLSDRLRKSLAKHDAAGMAQRTRERSQQRGVTMWMMKDGQARLAITGPYDSVTETMRNLTTVGHACRSAHRASDPDTPYSLDAARFDSAIMAVHRMYTELVSASERAGDAVVAIHSDPATHAGNLATAIHRDPGTQAGNLATAIHSDPGTHAGNLAGSTPSGDLPAGWTLAGTPGSRPRKQAAIIVDAATALHLADEPGFVPGYGWVPGPIAREILADCDSWRRWLLDDSTRTIIDAGAVRYRPSTALRDLISGRDVTCTADTCTRPASETQADHAIDFDGSNTTPANLHLVCGPDHLAVTAGHFVIDAADDGRALWVSTQSGHAYPSRVDPLHERSRSPYADLPSPRPTSGDV